jgi:hypothetical protein
MSTQTNPQYDAEDAAEALRRLIASAPSVTDPSDMHWLMSDMALSLMRLQHIAIQVAVVHQGQTHLAHSETGDAAGGRVQSLTVSSHLRRAAELLGWARTRLDLAMTCSDSIAWYDSASPTTAPGNATVPGTDDVPLQQGPSAGTTDRDGKPQS